MNLRNFYRWHVWLGWMLAVPFLLWTLSGLVMVARPIEEVRGEHLRAEAAAIETAGLRLPDMGGPAQAMRLAQIGARDQWVVEREGGMARYDARNGSPLGKVSEGEARQLADAVYIGTARLIGARLFTADRAPIDLRKERPAWQVRFGDGVQVYIDAETGETLALRTRFWRVFDFFWGLHIMDPQGRENTHSPWLVVFAAMAFASILIGIIMLLFRRKRTALL